MDSIFPLTIDKKGAENEKAEGDEEGGENDKPGVDEGKTEEEKKEEEKETYGSTTTAVSADPEQIVDEHALDAGGLFKTW